MLLIGSQPARDAVTAASPRGGGAGRPARALASTRLVSVLAIGLAVAGAVFLPADPQAMAAAGGHAAVSRVGFADTP